MSNMERIIYVIVIVCLGIGVSKMKTSNSALEQSVTLVNPIEASHE